MYLYKQFSKIYISMLLVSPKLPGFILEQHPTYSPFSWLSESRRNIKTLLLTAMHFSRLLYSQTKPIWERANKTTKKFHPKTDGQFSFFHSSSSLFPSVCGIKSQHIQHIISFIQLKRHTFSLFWTKNTCIYTGSF